MRGGGRLQFWHPSKLVGGIRHRSLRHFPRRAEQLRAVAGALGLAALFGAALFSNFSAALQADSKPPAAGQTETQSGTGTPTSSQSSIQVRVNVVNVPVSVLSKNGVPVIDMKKDEFQVFEDGREQSIKYFFFGSRPPLRIGLILDTSNSARRQLQFEKDAAQEFIFQMLQGRSSKNQIFLQTFDSTSSILQDFTNDPELLNEKIMDLKAGGGKALYDAIYTASREKMLNLGPPSESRRVLVVVTDGLDAQSRHTLEEALSMAHKAETVIYTLGITAYGYDNPGDVVLKEMADATGGAALFPREKTPGTNLDTGYLSHGQIGETSQNKGLGASTGIYSAERLEQLADSMSTIGRELTEQYNIGYTPLNDKMDGTYRNIRVIALRKGVEVRAKAGYFAIAQPLSQADGQGKVIVP